MNRTQSHSDTKSSHTASKPLDLSLPPPVSSTSDAVCESTTAPKSLPPSPLSPADANIVVEEIVVTSAVPSKLQKEKINSLRASRKRIRQQNIRESTEDEESQSGRHPDLDSIGGSISESDMDSLLDCTPNKNQDLTSSQQPFAQKHMETLRPPRRRSRTVEKFQVIHEYKARKTPSRSLFRDGSKKPKTPSRTPRKPHTNGIPASVTQHITSPPIRSPIIVPKPSVSAATPKLSSPDAQSVTDIGPVGQIIWARLTSGSKWWPAVTISGPSAGIKQACSDNQCVFWFGDHKVSEVALTRMKPFDKDFKSVFKKNSGAAYTSAVKEAIQECWKVLNSEDNNGDQVPVDKDYLLDWAASHFDPSQTKLAVGKVTKFVEDWLVKIAQILNSSDDEDMETGDSPPVNGSRKASERDHKERMCNRVRKGELDIESVCLACYDVQKSQPKAHPIFKGGLCVDCQDSVKESMFSFGLDGATSFCVVCGNGGELMVCDHSKCGRTFCTGCVRILGSNELLKRCEEAEPWLCFLCDETEHTDLDLLVKRDDWQQKLLEFFHKPSLLHRLPKPSPNRKLRVLSLFDGIGTAKVVLDNLGLDLEAYFASEIEEDAIQVVNLNHHGQVKQLGDVRHLSEEDLAALGRIDLLVGGSPCNDLALVNPARKGLYDAQGTGVLFFDFYRILLTLMNRQPDNTVLWLFENVVHMKAETKQIISRFLECQPVNMNAGYFSAQNRARYFWGNIPGMYSPINPEIMSQNIRLQDMLATGRSAVVGKIRTVTTRGASLLQGKNEDTHAVTMNGQSDKLWPTELEKIFGLPPHYTDVGNLAPGKRQKLLGRGWCVPVVEYILKPLTYLFATKE